MQAESNDRMREGFETWASELACPACLSALRLGEESVECTACGKIYPVVDGIPVLIVERAKPRG